MSEHSFVAHQFDDAGQQREASTLGMWIFLATEVMFFGGVFLGYIVYRSSYPQAFAAASNRLDIWLGLINTAVLICSSFTMVLAVYNAALDRRRGLQTGLLLTIVLGCTFLAIKFYEYHAKFEENLVPGAGFLFPPPVTSAAEIFFSFYFAMTGMHAAHMIVGIGLLGFLLFAAGRGRYAPEYFTPVEIVGLYWHFVDIVWIFLFPLLYLVGRHL
jgi:cytochrome c oxidase subunit 3